MWKWNNFDLDKIEFYSRLFSADMEENMKTKRKLLLIVLALALAICTAVGIFTVSADVVIMSTPAGAATDTVKRSARAFDFGMDKNGVSTKNPTSYGIVNWGNGSNHFPDGFKSISNYGMATPETYYSCDDDGSIFLLESTKYMVIGSETVDLELGRVINLTFTIDPRGTANSGWAYNEGLGQIGFALFADKEKLLETGNNAWNMEKKTQNGAIPSQADLYVMLWPSSGDSTKDNGAKNNGGTPTANINENHTKVSVQTSKSPQTTQRSTATVPIREVCNLTIFLGFKQGESYVKFNGQTIANLDITAKDLQTKSSSNKSTTTAVMGIYAYHNPVEMKLHVSQKENAQVSFASNVSGVTGLPSVKTVYAGQSVKLPATNPSKTGYTFEGWYLDAGCTVKYDNKAVYGNTTLYAKMLDNSLSDVTVTLTSDEGGYDPITLVVDSGTRLTSIGNVFGNVGHYATWKDATSGTAYNGEAITSNKTLKAEWHEEELKLKKVSYGTVSSKVETPVADINGFTTLKTDPSNGESYVDATTGETVVKTYYGSYYKALETKPSYSAFAMQAQGAMTNIAKLDVTKPMLFKINLQNWDYNHENDNVNAALALDSNCTFMLFDSLREALMAGSDVGHLGKGEKVAITTSTLNRGNRYGNNYYGVFYDMLAGVSSNDWYGYKTKNRDSLDSERDDAHYNWYTLEIYISEDGNSNRFTIKHTNTNTEGNDERVVNWFDMTSLYSAAGKKVLNGIKQSDFVDGYAYFHIANLGSSHAYSVNVSQQISVTKTATTNGTFTVQYEDATSAVQPNTTIPLKPLQDNVPTAIWFNSAIKMNIVPNSGFGISSVKIGDTYIDATVGESVYYLKARENGTMQVVFGRMLKVYYELNGAIGLDWEPTDVVEGKTIEEPEEKPRRAGVRFVGWYTDPELTNKFDFDDPVTDNMTLYAGYSDTVSGTVSGGGTSGGTNANVSGGANNNEKEYKTCGASVGVSVVFPVVIVAAITAVVLKIRRKED